MQICSSSNVWYSVVRGSNGACLTFGFQFFPFRLSEIFVLCCSIVIAKFIRRSGNLFDSTQAFGRSTKMAQKPKQPNTKPRQFEIMVDFMKQHSDLGKGPIKGLTARQTSDQLWKRLAEDLNQNGPPIHSFVEWKKIWADYKNHVKSKLRKNRMNMSGTGGGPSKMCSLTATEEEVVTLMCMENAINGTPRTGRFGASDDSVDDIVLLTPSVNILAEDTVRPMREQNHGTEVNLEAVRPRASTTRGGHESLLRMQVENPAVYQRESVSRLEQMCDNLASLSRYARKNFELKEKSIALKREKFEFKKQKEKERTKLSLEKLELKKQILDLELQKL